MMFGGTSVSADDAVSTDATSMTSELESSSETDTTSTLDSREETSSTTETSIHTASSQEEEVASNVEENRSESAESTGSTLSNSDDSASENDSTIDVSTSDYSASANTTATITFDDSGLVATTSQGVTIDGTTVTISQSGTYTLTGNGTSYTIIVSGSITDPVILVLDDVTLTDSNIVSESAAELTVNVFSDSSISSNTGNAIEAAGALIVTSATNSTLTLSSTAKHALKADSVTIDSVTLDLTSSDKDGIHATTDITITNAAVTITAGDDGIQVEDDTDVNGGDVTITDSTVTTTASDKGIMTTDALTIAGDSVVTINAGDEGLEGRYLHLTGGTINITVGDDGINATEWTEKDNAVTSNLTNSAADLENSVAIVIDGATVTILAAGDGIDSNGDVTFKSGSLYVAQTSQDNAVVDYDETGIISGGTVWAIGSQGMAQAFMTGSSQSYITVNISGSNGDTITISDSSGNVIATTTATAAFSSVVFSAEALESGQTYTITTSSGSTANTSTTTGTSNTSDSSRPTPPIGGFPSNTGQTASTPVDTINQGERSVTKGLFKSRKE